MCTLDQNLADALCAIIACGFMDKMDELHAPGVSSNNYTDFIYEGDAKEQARYERLRSELNKLDIHVEFKDPPSKETAPFIMAKTRQLTEDVEKGLQNDMMKWSSALEEKINRTSGGLRGAYLGGYSSISKTEVLGVSDLYQYEPAFRKEDVVNCAAKIRPAYDSAKAVTNAVISSLSSSQHFVTKYVRPIPEELKLVDEPYQKGHLFASVHGMTRAILAYSPLADIDTHSVRFELALGSATSKVASCIPCSLLMAAMGQPATATHLGRGDNWNFAKYLDPTGARIKLRNL